MNDDKPASSTTTVPDISSGFGQGCAIFLAKAIVALPLMGAGLLTMSASGIAGMYAFLPGMAFIVVAFGIFLSRGNFAIGATFLGILMLFLFLVAASQIVGAGMSRL